MKIALNLGKGRVLAGVAVSMVLSTSAFAQCTTAPVGVPGPLTDQLATAAAAGGAASGAFAGALGNLATAFLSQQGSAFVSAPGNPKPDQEGGGVWARAVGGEVSNKFTSNATGSITAPLLPNLNTAVTANCLGSVHQSFAGMQVGQDISRLNVRGWNFHLGTMAGYLASHATDSTGGKTDFDVPFFGTYLVATYGRFFADISVRKEFYSAVLNSPTVGIFDQRVGAGGVSVSTSAGYNFALDNNWFIEPSAGFIWSRTNVDSFNVSGGLGAAGIVSTYNTDPIDSKIGRLGVRVGTTISSGNMIWQPFASVNVFHEFAGNVTSTASSIKNGAFAFDPNTPPFFSPATLLGTNSTTRVGTYGQYSVGLAAQVANTGWLGFVRGDYRHGDYIDGWTANAGIRYQFTPETIAAVMPTKAPVKAVGIIPATNWTGFYVGGFLGGVYGNTDIRFVGDPNNAGNNPRTAGALGGFQAGYNYHAPNNFVFGIEGDVGAANMHGARTCGPDSGKDPNTGIIVRFTPAFLNCEATASWMATLAGRLGVAWGRTLYYVKAGGAITDDNVNVKCIFGPFNGNPFVGSCLNPAGVFTNGFGTSGTRAGWLVGFGTEFDLGKNWSAKAEYDFIDFGSRTATATDGTTVMRDSGTLSQVKIGLNYRFSGPTAVVAKY